MTAKQTSNILSIAIITFFAAMILMSFASIQKSEEERLYKRNCAMCHGYDGSKGMFGAKNLRQSALVDSAILQQIENGKGRMPSFKKKFTKEECNALLAYVKGLRGK